ncbi:hypothetical protein QCA50_001512 [Cerrena zonata]|uniref:Major facilitator superfamily (MFS) profile domain-containing protein n=1 Tax=Cerrena zonata TaxID=2478898 RepID=A0AAW0GXD0_9APHY
MDDHPYIPQRIFVDVTTALGSHRTIISTCLPTIAAQFNASQIEYTWVGVSYMLTQTAFQPLYGRLSDLIGRKPVLFGSMFIFVVGSILCGAANSMLWLVMARALAGVGGGGIVSLVWTITSEIVEFQSRAKWSQALSITWSCSAVAGPLLGGLFSGQHGLLSWRWAFYLNLPVCLIAFVVLWISLRGVDVDCSHDVSWNQFRQRFDFVGLLLFMTGSSSIIVGFSFASLFGWRSPVTLTLIVAGLIILAIGSSYELKTHRDALFPPSAFRDRTTIIILVINFLHQFVFNIGTFYLALYFQSVQDLSPIRAGLTMLPYSLGSSLASMPTAWFIGYWQRRTLDTSGQKMVITVGLAIAAVGFGLMVLLDEKSLEALQSVFPLIAGLGLGMLFHTPYQIFTRTLRPKEIASGTSAFFLVRFTGATVGLAVAGALFHSRLYHLLPGSVDSNTLDLEDVASFEPSDLRDDVISAVADAIQTIWIVCCPCLGAAFLTSFFMRNISSEPPSEEVTIDSDKTVCTLDTQQSGLALSLVKPEVQV